MNSSDQREIVDVDDPDSWPGSVVDLVEEVVGNLADDEWLAYPFDHIGIAEFEPQERLLRDLLSQHRLLAYHATRLLPHEIAEIAGTTGLRILTEDLRVAKVESALEHYPEYAESDPGGLRLLSDGPNSWQGTADVRLGRLDFMAPFGIFEHQSHGFWNLLDTWGGETLGWLREGRESSALLQDLTASSRPAIVEFAVRIPTLNTYRMLLPAFAGAHASADDYWGQWWTAESIPSEFVLAVLTPDDVRWPEALALAG